MSHPVNALLGRRLPASQHTDAEDDLLRRWASKSETIVELGVAEGGSACSMRESMPSTATLWLVDPYFPGRLPVVSVPQLVARRAVRGVRNGRVRWVRALSWDAGAQWSGPLVDLLFIDADHSYESVTRDWQAWRPHVRGVVAFHDSRCYDRGHLTPDDGPVRLVEEILSGGGWDLMDAADSISVLAHQSTPE